MEKGARPVKAKAEARSAVAGKSQPFDGSTGLQLEQRLAEASAQHAAISQILQVISASPRRRAAGARCRRRTGGPSV